MDKNNNEYVDWDVKTVQPLPDYRLKVETKSGKKGIFDMKPYLNYGAYQQLKDLSYFNQVFILYGAISWPNEQDIAPETLLTKMQPYEENKDC